MIIKKITAACIAASVVSPAFAQSIDSVEKLMRQVLPKEAVCKRGMGASICDYETPKYTIGLTASDGSMIGLGMASARVKLKMPLVTGQATEPFAMLEAFFNPFNFDKGALLDCINKGHERNQWDQAEVKSADKEFKLKCYGQASEQGWTLVMADNNEF